MTHRAAPAAAGRRARLLQVLCGTTAMGAAIALILQARTGLLPLDVLHAGISARTGWTIGGAFVATQALFLVLYRPLQIPWGVGTVAAAIVPGAVCDVVVASVPAPDQLWARVVFLLVGAAAFVVGVAAYLGADWGALPRDGVMLEIGRRRAWSLARTRVVFDVASLALGVVLLGPANAWSSGAAGPSSLVLALTLGPAIARVLPRFDVTRRD